MLPTASTGWTSLTLVSKSGNDGADKGLAPSSDANALTDSFGRNRPRHELQDSTGTSRGLNETKLAEAHEGQRKLSVWLASFVGAM